MDLSCPYEVRLDRLIGKWGGWGKRHTRDIIKQGKVRCDGRVVQEGRYDVGKFIKVECGSEVVQANIARYVMLFKPLGVVSATVDEEHPTVVSLIKEDWASELHLAGRLDRFTSGLMILTNDGAFSEALTFPGQGVGKRYRVGVDGPIREEVVKGFKAGMWFEKEGAEIAPAELELLSERECLLTIYEGKHHQVKRMFARYDLKVIALHRESMGQIELDSHLKPGEWRELTSAERFWLG